MASDTSLLFYVSCHQSYGIAVTCIDAIPFVFLIHDDGAVIP